MYIFSMFYWAFALILTLSSQKSSKDFYTSLRCFLFCLYFSNIFLSFFVFFYPWSIFFSLGGQLLLVCSDDSTSRALHPCSNCQSPNNVSTESEQEFNFGSRITENNSSYFTARKGTQNGQISTSLQIALRCTETRCLGFILVIDLNSRINVTSVWFFFFSLHTQMRLQLRQNESCCKVSHTLQVTQCSTFIPNVTPKKQCSSLNRMRC